MASTTERRYAWKHQLYEMQDGKCFYCDDGLAVTPLTRRKQGPHFWTLDRIIPGAKGGRYTWGNLVLACRDCNEKRGSRPADIFLIESYNNRLTCEAA